MLKFEQKNLDFLLIICENSTKNNTFSLQYLFFTPNNFFEYGYESFFLNFF